MDVRFIAGRGDYVSIPIYQAEDEDSPDRHIRRTAFLAQLRHLCSFCLGFASQRLKSCKRRARRSVLGWYPVLFLGEIILGIGYAAYVDYIWAILSMVIAFLPEIVLAPFGRVWMESSFRAQCEPRKDVIRTHMGNLPQLTLQIYILAKQLTIAKPVSNTIYLQIPVAAFLAVFVLQDIISVPQRWRDVELDPVERSIPREYLLNANFADVEREARPVPPNILHFFGKCLLLAVRISVIVLFSLEFGAYVFVALLSHILIGAVSVSANYLQKWRCNVFVLDTNQLPQLSSFWIRIISWILHPCSTVFYHFYDPLIGMVDHELEFFFYCIMLMAENAIVLGWWAQRMGWSCTIAVSVVLSCMSAFAFGASLLYTYWGNCYWFARQRTMAITCPAGDDDNHDSGGLLYDRLFEVHARGLDRMLTRESVGPSAIVRMCRAVWSFLGSLIRDPHRNDAAPGFPGRLWARCSTFLSSKWTGCNSFLSAKWTDCSSSLTENWKSHEVCRDLTQAIFLMGLFVLDLGSDWGFLFKDLYDREFLLAGITFAFLMLPWPFLAFRTLAAHRNFTDENGTLIYNVPEGRQLHTGYNGIVTRPNVSFMEYFHSLTTYDKVIHLCQLGPILRYCYYIRNRGHERADMLSSPETSSEEKNRYAALRTQKSLTTHMRLFELYLETLPQTTLQIVLLVQKRLDKRLAAATDTVDIVWLWLSIVRITVGFLVVLFGIVTTPNGHVSAGNAYNVLCFDSEGTLTLKLVRFAARMLTLTVRIIIIVMFLTCLAPWIAAVFAVHAVIIVTGLRIEVLRGSTYTDDFTTVYPLGRHNYTWESTFWRRSVWIFYPFATFFDHFSNLKLVSVGQPRREFFFYYTLMLIENTVMLACWAGFTESSCSTVTITLLVLTSVYLCGVLVLGKRSIV